MTMKEMIDGLREKPLPVPLHLP